jgi:hypothetical protein
VIESLFSFTSDELRHSILELLYNRNRAVPRNNFFNREEMLEILRIPDPEIDFNIFYLRDMKLITLVTAPGKSWVCASITAFGINVIEHKAKYSEEFSFVNTTIKVLGNNNVIVTPYGNSNSTVNVSQDNFSNTVSKAFIKAYEEIENKDDITLQKKIEIKNWTKLLEEELQTIEPDAGKIQKAWKWLKHNADWLVPTLSQIVTDGIKIACGI